MTTLTVDSFWVFTLCCLSALLFTSSHSVLHQSQLVGMTMILSTEAGKRRLLRASQWLGQHLRGIQWWTGICTKTSDSKALRANQDTKTKGIPETSILVSACFLAISVFSMITWISLFPEGSWEITQVQQICRASPVPKRSSTCFVSCQMLHKNKVFSAKWLMFALKRTPRPQYEFL